MQGGAMYALERGLHMKWLALLFAFFGGFASFGIGCATQVNAIATVCNENLNISPVFIGIAVAALTALVIFGGIKSIATVCERLVPFMAFFYVLGCLIILGINYDFIIPAVKTICKMAFTPGAAAGGLVGRGIMMAMQYGIARGLFPMSQVWVLPLSQQLPPRREILYVRHWFPAPELSGIPLLYVS